MKISEISAGKVKIVLTNTEVLSCFGAYEKLFEMSFVTKNAIKALLRDIIKKHYNHQKISAEIRAEKNYGCVIILTAIDKRNKTVQIAYEFYNSESLITGSLNLYKIFKNTPYNSAIYKISDKYYIIINTVASAFPKYKTKSFDNVYTDAVKCEIIKEYGNIITENNALEKISSAFLKEI